MPKRSLVGCLLAAWAANWAVPAEAQNFRRPQPTRQSRPQYQDFAPGPALARQDGIDPEVEKTKARAQDAFRTQDFKRAIALVDPIIRRDPKDAVGLHIRGMSRIKLGVRENDVKLVRDGIADARTAVTEGADDESGAVYYIPYLDGMLALARMEGNKDHAQVVVDVAQQVLDLELKAGEKANLRFQRASAYVFMQKFEEAAGEYQAAIDIDNSHIGAYVSLADCLAKAGKHDEAEVAYDNAVEAFSNSSLIHNNRGSYLRTRGDLDGAARDFAKAVEIDEKFVVGWINLGFVRMQKGEAASAEACFDQALALDPERKNVFGLRGQVRISQGKLKAGIADIEATLKAFPKYADGFSNLGFAKFYAADYRGALTAFDEATKLNPGLKHLDTWRMLCLVSLDETDDLMTRFEDSLKKEADKRDWVDQMIVYLSGEQTAEELLAAIATDVDPDDEEADKEAIRTRADQQTCEAHFVIGRKLLADGEEEAAKDHFAKVLETDAKYLSAYRGAQFQLGRFSVAEKTSSTDRN